MVYVVGLYYTRSCCNVGWQVDSSVHYAEMISKSTATKAMRIAGYRL